MNDPPPNPALTGLDLAFIHRVYRTTAILAVLAMVFLWEGLGPRAALSWALGVGLSLVGLGTTEWTVRRTVQSHKQSTILVALAVKFPLILLVLYLLFLGAQRGWINLIMVLAGFALPHVVLSLKLLGRKVLELYRQDPDG